MNMNKKIKEANIIKPVGRPAENKSAEDTAKGHQVSLSENEKRKLVSIYGGLTKAIKTLLPKDKK